VSGVLAVVVLAAGANAQQPATTADPIATGQAFDVISVKPSTPGSGTAGFMPQPGGRLVVTGMPVRLLIRVAYQLQDYQIVGGPDWMAAERFDIIATGKADFTKGTEAMMVPVRALLTELERQNVRERRLAGRAWPRRWARRWRHDGDDARSACDSDLLTSLSGRAQVARAQVCPASRRGVGNRCVRLRGVNAARITNSSTRPRREAGVSRRSRSRSPCAVRLSAGP